MISSSSLPESDTLLDSPRSVLNLSQYFGRRDAKKMHPSTVVWCSSQRDNSSTLRAAEACCEKRRSPTQLIYLWSVVSPRNLDNRCSECTLTSPYVSLKAVLNPGACVK